MDMLNQTEAIDVLSKYADHDSHAILISGPEGCGKSYLAKQYAKMKNISNFQIVSPKMDIVREAMAACYRMSTDILVCIENLDMGVIGVAYAILKFLEEPKSNVYIVITCRNIRQVPDTILSRCVTASLSSMLPSDLKQYAEAKLHTDTSLQVVMDNDTLWRCVTSTADIEVLANLDAEKISYITTLCGAISLDTSVSAIVWKLQNFPDKTPTPINIVVRYLMYTNTSWTKRCLCCLNDLACGRLGTHAVLSKLVLELKYGDAK